MSDNEKHVGQDVVKTGVSENPSGGQSEDESQVGSHNSRERLEWWTELIAVVLLSIATIGVAWSGYQSARWGGIQSTSYAEASGKRVEASRAAALGNTEISVEVSMFMSWLEAYYSGETELADFIASRFPDEFKPAFEAWMAADPMSNPGAPPTPFDTSEYTIVSIAEAVRLEAEANALLQEGKTANERSDQYIFNTVILASVLFFAGIAQRRFRRLEYRVALTVLGSGMLIYGLVNILTYQVA